MKNLMRILAILLAFAAVILIINKIIEPSYGDDFYSFSNTIATIVGLNILPILSIAICAYCLERNDTNYIIRIIPIYMSIPILLTIIMAVFETNAQWIFDVYGFIASTFTGVTLLSVIMIIKPNNKITILLRYIAFGILAANVIFVLISQIKSYMVDTLPNVYGYKNYGGFNFSTVEETNEVIAKLTSITSLAQLFVLPLLFITNYAFSDKIELETDDIDYDVIKQEAMNVANTQMQRIYNKDEIKEEVIDRSASEKGLMNVNNQLGQDSNVGNVKTQAREMNVTGSSLDALVPLSSGPVVNDAAVKETPQPQQVEQAPETKQEPVQTEVTTPPNLDIQEQMKLRMQQVQNQQQVQQAEQPVQNQNIQQ